MMYPVSVLNCHYGTVEIERVKSRVDRNYRVRRYEMTQASKARLYRVVNKLINPSVVLSYNRPKVTLFLGGFELEW